MRELKSTTTRTITLCSCSEHAGSLLLSLSPSSVLTRGGVLIARGGRIDPNIDSIDTKASIGIGSILA